MQARKCKGFLRTLEKEEVVPRPGRSRELHSGAAGIGGGAADATADDKSGGDGEDQIALPLGKPGDGEGARTSDVGSGDDAGQSGGADHRDADHGRRRRSTDQTRRGDGENEKRQDDK